jgi:hypothetical protein
MLGCPLEELAKANTATTLTKLNDAALGMKLIPDVSPPNDENRIAALEVRAIEQLTRNAHFWVFWNDSRLLRPIV